MQTHFFTPVHARAFDTLAAPIPIFQGGAQRCVCVTLAGVAH
ncbi:hypothetical protein BSU04_17300 [Caballeronia sordidicola]|uniref:Uncharacterized protein n=1 Tax=Caballeronia sordidicola TaxID=196367 RepID=A0A226X2T6_CABSO|nr:hypothetical protein BSU04_17300 [Caballeronia sordidicola]